VPAEMTTTSAFSCFTFTPYTKNQLFITGLNQ
jgi:hypothetical protein